MPKVITVLEFQIIQKQGDKGRKHQEPAKSISAYIEDVKSWIHVFGIVVKEGEVT